MNEINLDKIDSDNKYKDLQNQLLKLTKQKPRRKETKKVRLQDNERPHQQTNESRFWKYFNGNGTPSVP